MNLEGSKKPKRNYRPSVEALEALRLFHAAVPDLPDLAPDHADFGHSIAPLSFETTGPDTHTHAWDEVLAGPLSDLIGPSSVEVLDSRSVQEGLSQLDRYLGKTWARAGLAPSKAEDCTQAVYLILIQTWGRPGFDRLLTDIGQNGIRDVLSRETDEGPDFFRAIDTVKKRAQREKSFLSIEEASHDPSTSSTASDLSAVLHEAIQCVLTPKEAELIRATLSGESPSEIADRWGVAPKTVSNEKTRILHKLRDFLQTVESPY